MIRMGIVGAENSHTAAIAKLLNVDRRIEDVRVVSLWGETAEFARKAAETGQVPDIVAKPEDMIGKIDAVMIDHRHAKYHVPAAEPFLAARLPMFIDKPFCFRVAEGRDFLSRARRAGVPVTSFSTVPEQASFRSFQADVGRAGQIQALVSTGPCDIESPYGGIFFYGIHQVGALLKLAGTDVASVQVHAFASSDRHTATLQFRSGVVATLNLLKSCKPGFHFMACCDGGIATCLHPSDPEPYLSGAVKFTTMFRTGVEPEPHEDILAPIRVLEAMEESIRTGQRVLLA
jgi:predicted dehydrogenase